MLAPAPPGNELRGRPQPLLRRRHGGAPRILFPRLQTAAENCTWHNLNVVPTDGRYVLVAGNYQGGISVVDFTDLANASEIARRRPRLRLPTQLGGDWSTYWYDGRIYESDITRGLLTSGS